MASQTQKALPKKPTSSTKKKPLSKSLYSNYWYFNQINSIICQLKSSLEYKWLFLSFSHFNILEMLFSSNQQLSVHIEKFARTKINERSVIPVLVFKAYWKMLIKSTLPATS